MTPPPDPSLIGPVGCCLYTGKPWTDGSLLCACASCTAYAKVIARERQHCINLIQQVADTWKGYDSPVEETLLHIIDLLQQQGR
jgi:hypothetical protein